MSKKLQEGNCKIIFPGVVVKKVTNYNKREVGVHRNYSKSSKTESLPVPTTSVDEIRDSILPVDVWPWNPVYQDTESDILKAVM